MKEEWRLILNGANDAPTNMAIDEALLRCVAMGKSISTVRFYQWAPSAVSIGYFQGINQEVDLDVCRERKVDVVRRLTGGGAVYHDSEGEITYAVTAKEGHPKIPKNIMESYQVLCAGLVAGFANLGIKAEFKPINDIIVNNKKISGNAQTRRFGGIFQHGTLLCSVNPTLMFSLLKVPNEKIRDKMIEAVKERVTSIEHEKGNIAKKTVIDAMIRGFEEALDIKLTLGDLTREEKEIAMKVKQERYENNEWNYKR